MFKNSKHVLYMTLVLTLIITVFSGCEKPSKEQPNAPSIHKFSFRDIPGITKDEIKAIEALQKKYGSFVYAMDASTEAFIGRDGEIHGYAPLFCGWLTEVFGIPFEITFHEWSDLLKRLETGDIDFTGELMFTPERRKTYFLSNPTVERSMKIYRIKDSEPLNTIIKSRPPRYAFLRGSVLSVDVTENTGYDFKTVFIDDYNTAYRMLKNGEVDAYFGMDTSDVAFKAFNDVVTEDFYPLIFKPACLSTQKAELAPIISAVDKMLDEKTLIYLSELYKEGSQQYLKYRLYNQMTEEERAYIQKNSVIPVAAEFNNYPVCFFDANTVKWHGIFFDTLDEVTKLTGLKFKRANDQIVQNHDLIAMLEKGEVLIIPELFRMKEYEGRFLWSEIPLLQDNFAFLSKSSFKNIEINQIPYLTVGVRKNSVYFEFFKKMFPNHRHLVEYDTQEEVWNALKHDEVEVIFACNRRLLTYTNFYEEAGYKLNLIIDYSFDSSFGYNKDAVILKSIIDKTLRIININNISNQWMHKTYDYRYKLAEAQRPLLIGVIVLFFFVLVLVVILLIRSRNSGKHLQQLVNQRTNALEFETSKLKAVLDSIPDFMFCKDINYRYTQCNNFYEEFLGIREADILGKTDKEGDFLHPEHVEMIHKVEQAVINENKIYSVEEKVHSPVTGKENFFETVKAPIKQNGAVVGIVAIIRDITKRKEMEKELAIQTSLFKTMLSSLPDAVFCKDLDFKYTLCNNYMADILNKKAEDIIGKDDVEALGLPPETAAIANETDKKVMVGQQRVSYEEWILCGDGVTRLFETVKSPLILNNEVVGIMAIARDITQRKEMEEDAQAASRAKSSFLANMSHELRTPLNVVIGLTELILEDDMSDHVRRNLIKISSAGTTLLSIVNDILDFSKIESGKLTLSPVEYYTSSILNDIITLTITRLGEKPIKFHLDIPDDLPNKLFGDDLRVKQVLTNLLTNAIKYTQEGNITLKARSVREGDTVWLDFAVSDTGMGMSKDNIKHLFSDYYQIDDKANRYIEGTGLGLAITKRLVEMMEGQINVESEKNKGSTFSFRIKQGFVDDAVLGADVSGKLRNFSYTDDKRLVSKKLVRVNLSYARVLVVDDMQTNLDVASGILRKYKMQVDCLTNGQAAVERIKAGIPIYNAIFMDHMMPGMDGIETVDRIRALETEYAKKIPIIALTANAIQGTEKMFFEHDFQAFVTKPIDIMEMDIVLKKWVYDRDREAALSAVDDSSEEKEMVIEIPGVDAKKGLALYADDTDIYLPLLRSYITNTPNTLEKLRSVSAENLSDYVISVHGLKGTSAGIGAEDIRAQALDLENLSRAGDLQGVLAKNDKLIADTEIIVANVKAWLDQNDIHETKPRLKAPDRELLAKLRESCESYDMDTVEKIMKELEKADYDEDAELVKWIREKIDISKLGEVAKRLTEI